MKKPAPPWIESGSFGGKKKEGDLCITLPSPHVQPPLIHLFNVIPNLAISKLEFANVH